MLHKSVLFNRLPADLAEALAAECDVAARALRIRAARAREAVDYRHSLRERKRANEHIWSVVESFRRRGRRLEEALAAAGEQLQLTLQDLRAAYDEAAARAGPHKRRRRDLELARRAAAGESYQEIGAAVGLHAESVGRIVRRILHSIENADLPSAPLAGMGRADDDEPIGLLAHEWAKGDLAAALMESELQEAFGYDYQTTAAAGAVDGRARLEAVRRAANDALEAFIATPALSAVGVALKLRACACFTPAGNLYERFFEAALRDVERLAGGTDAELVELIGAEGGVEP